MSKLKTILVAGALLFNSYATADQNVWQDAAEKRKSAGRTYQIQAINQKKEAQILQSLEEQSNFSENLYKISEYYGKAAELEERAYIEYFLAGENFKKSILASDEATVKKQINEQNNSLENIAYTSCIRASNYLKLRAKNLNRLASIQLKNLESLEKKTYTNEQERISNIYSQGTNLYQAAFTAEKAYRSYLGAVYNLEKMPQGSDKKATNLRSEACLTREVAYEVLKETQQLYELAVTYFDSCGNLAMKTEAERKDAWCTEQIALRPSKKKVN